MLIIERPRDSGKTTMLLHHMLMHTEDCYYVAWTEDCAKHAFRKSQELGLEIAEDRFMGASYFESHACRNFELLVDDIDYILKRDFKLGCKLIKYADVMTITKGD